MFNHILTEQTIRNLHLFISATKTEGQSLDFLNINKSKKLQCFVFQWDQTHPLTTSYSLKMLPLPHTLSCMLSAWVVSLSQYNSERDTLSSVAATVNLALVGDVWGQKMPDLFYTVWNCGTDASLSPSWHRTIQKMRHSTPASGYWASFFFRISKDFSRPVTVHCPDDHSVGTWFAWIPEAWWTLRVHGHLLYLVFICSLLL